MPHLPRLLAPLLILVVTGCTSGDSASNAPGKSAKAEPDAPAATAGGPTTAPPAPAAPAQTCDLVEADAQIETIELRSADGACRAYLPIDAKPGTYPVRISAAGGEGAAVELQREGTRLIGTTGELRLESVDGGRLRGTIEASDEAPPETGLLRGRIDAPTPR